MTGPGFIMRVSRPRFWIYTFGPFLVGLVAAISSMTDILRWPNLVFALYFLFPANLLIYGVNDIFDYDTDRINVKKQDYEDLVEPSSYKRLSIWIAVANLPFLILSLILFPYASIALAGFLFFSVFYSTPPIRAKAIPVLDSAFNILYIFPGIFIYILLTGQFPPAAIFISGAAWTAAMHAYSAIPDIEADRAAGLSTIATLLGQTGTFLFCLAMYTVSTYFACAYLGLAAIILGAIYALMIVISMVLSNRTFAIYKWFPAVNSVCGFVLFWTIAYSKFF